MARGSSFLAWVLDAYGIAEDAAAPRILLLSYQHEPYQTKPRREEQDFYVPQINPKGTPSVLLIPEGPVSK